MVDIILKWGHVFISIYVFDKLDVIGKHVRKWVAYAGSQIININSEENWTQYTALWDPRDNWKKLGDFAIDWNSAGDLWGMT